MVVGPVESFAVGQAKQVTIRGRAIAIFRTAEQFYALRDSCPHMGAALSDGVVVGSVEASEPGCYEYFPDRKYVRCPWHGWEYELATGQSWFNPEHSKVRYFPTSVVDGATIVHLDDPVESADSADSSDSAGEPEPGRRVKGPFTAESFVISVEDDYVVIEI